MADYRKAGKQDRKDSEKTIRTFVAIELPDAVITELGRLQDGIRGLCLPAKWTRPESIHLTLKFLGDVELSQMDAIGERIASAALESAPMILFAQGLGVFPNVRRPRVLWTGVGGDTDVLESLQYAVESELEAIGYKKEKRRFSGHFTLARFKDRVDPEMVVSVTERFSGFVSSSFTGDSVHLFQSRLSPGGAVYTKLISHPLGR